MSCIGRRNASQGRRRLPPSLTFTPIVPPSSFKQQRPSKEKYEGAETLVAIIRALDGDVKTQCALLCSHIDIIIARQNARGSPTRKPRSGPPSLRLKTAEAAVRTASDVVIAQMPSHKWI